EPDRSATLRVRSDADGRLRDRAGIHRHLARPKLPDSPLVQRAAGGVQRPGREESGPLSPTILHGDSLDVLRMYEDNAFDAIVTDPPYGLSFMGKRWDYDVPSVDLWAECLRVLKPGG